MGLLCDPYPYEFCLAICIVAICIVAISIVVLFINSSSTHIILQCDPDEEGKLESVAVPTNVDNDFQMVSHLRLFSNRSPNILCTFSTRHSCL